MAQTYTRLIVALIVAILDILKVFGFDFGIEEETLYNVILSILTLVLGFRVAYKNWNVSDEAKFAQKVLDALKSGDATFYDKVVNKDDDKQ